MLLPALLWAGLASSCVTLEDEVIPPDAPVALYPGAAALRGATLDEVRRVAATTLPSGTMDVRAIERAAKKSRSAVVSIYFKAEQKAKIRLIPFKIPFLGIPVKLPGKGMGSGFIIHEDGYVITNAHVVRDAKDIRLVTYDGVDLDVEVLATDPVFDLALLKIVGTQGPFPVLPMGNSALANVGTWTIAVGNPLGLGHTVTLGIISQTGRHLSGVKPEEGREVAFIQMDTAINPGSSGGPLITLTGAWVGVNTASYTHASGISFAVPSRVVNGFLANVLAGRGVEMELEE